MPIYTSFRGRAGGATINDTQEIWSFGCYWDAVDSVESAPSQAAMDALAQNAYGALKDFINVSAMNFASNMFATECRAYFYPFGPQDPASVIGYSIPDAGDGGPAGNSLPLQISNVVSLVAAGRVKPKYGRFYLPPQAFAMQADGRLAAATALAYATGARNFLNAVDAVIGTALEEDYELIIQSRTGQQSRQRVREIRVGRVPDTQRRRRNNLTESYTSLNYPS